MNTNSQNPGTQEEESNASDASSADAFFSENLDFLAILGETQQKIATQSGTLNA